MAWQEAGPDGRVRPVCELEADAGTVRQDQDAGNFERAVARLYSSGKQTARLQAPHVAATMKGKRVKAWGGVTIDVMRPEGLRVQADRLDGYLDKDLVVARGHVRFVQKDPRTNQLIAEGGVFVSVTFDTRRERLTVP